MKNRFLLLFCSLVFLSFSCDKNKNKSSFSGYSTILIGNQVVESNNLKFNTESFTSPSSNATSTITKITIQNTNGSYFIISIDGTDVGFYPLTSVEPNTASYFNTEFFEYLSLTGEINITEYVETDTKISITGVFAFQGQSLIDQSFITINDGVFSVSKEK